MSILKTRLRRCYHVPGPRSYRIKRASTSSLALGRCSYFRTCARLKCLATSGRSNFPAPAVIWGKDAMVAGNIDAGLRHQGSQTCDEIYRRMAAPIERHLRGAIPVARLRICRGSSREYDSGSLARWTHSSLRAIVAPRASSLRCLTQMLAHFHQLYRSIAGEQLKLPEDGMRERIGLRAAG